MTQLKAWTVKSLQREIRFQKKELQGVNVDYIQHLESILRELKKFGDVEGGEK